MRRREKLSPEKERIVKEIEKAGILYIEPKIMSKIPKELLTDIRNEDDLKEIIYRQFGDFPDSLLRFLATHKEARIAIGIQVKAGEYTRRHLVAIINPLHIIPEEGVFQEEIIHLLDHLLGGQSDKISITLSTGFGLNADVERLGKEINDLYKRGKYFSDYMEKNEREYLAQSVREFLQSGEEAIAELDPPLYNMIKEKFLNEDYWRQVL